MTICCVHMRLYLNNTVHTKGEEATNVAVTLLNE